MLWLFSACLKDDHKHFQLLWIQLNAFVCLLNLEAWWWIMGLNIKVLCLFSWNMTPFCVLLYFSQCRWIIVLAKHSSKIILWIASIMLLIFYEVLNILIWLVFRLSIVPFTYVKMEGVYSPLKVPKLFVGRILNSLHCVHCLNCLLLISVTHMVLMEWLKSVYYSWNTFLFIQCRILILIEQRGICFKYLQGLGS